MTTVLTLALAALIGLSLALLGSGGSIITLPMLVYVAGLSAQEAVGMSLVIVGGTSTVGSLLNLRHGLFNRRAAALFSVSGVAGAFVGARFTHLVSASVLLLLFGGLMLVVGARMLIGAESDTQPGRCGPWRCLGVGFAVGILTGFLGVGGGFLILPALVLFAGLEMKTAVGTSLAVIAINCLGGLASHLRYLDFNWPLTIGFLAAAVAGMLAGTAVEWRLAVTTLRRGFAWCVLLLGVALVTRNAMAVISTP